MSTSATAPQCYLGPREVVSGPGSSARLAESFAKWSIRRGRVLVVRDAIVAKLGLAAKAMEALAVAGYQPVTYDDVVNEPTREMAADVLARAREQAVTGVVGIGGGSSMDLAKIAAAFAPETVDIDAIIGGAQPGGDVLPLTLMPTTAGTGAEATSVSMLSAGGHKKIVISHRFVPLLAVLDPELIVSLPQSVTASGGLDAVSHAVEAFVSTSATPLTESASRSAVRLLADALPRAYDHGDDVAARTDTLIGSHLAGWSLNARVVLGHSIAYTIATRTHLPHGVTTGMSLAYALAYSLPSVEDRLAELAAQIPSVETPDAAGLIRWAGALPARVGVPVSLDAIGIPASEVPRMAEEIVRDYPRPNNPVPLETGRVTTLLEHFHVGDLDGAVNAMKI